ncbi:MAG: ribose-phosphate diphosphokinase [Steroidobacteraceae bacterium]
MMLFAPHHSVAFARAVADSLGISLSAAEEREFGGGEHKMRPLVDVQDQDICIVQSLCGDVQASANDKLCRLLFFIGALKDAGAARITAAVPYLAYARKDRRTQPKDPVTSRYVAQLFEAVGVDCVIVLDVHNEAAFDNAFRCRTVRIEAASTFATALAPQTGERPLVVASPDIGGVKRAQRLRDAIAQQMAHPIDFAFVEKHREGGVVSGDALVGPVAGRDVVFYDDMIVSGTTIVRAAQAARRAGAIRVHVAASHAAFVQSALALFEGGLIDTVLVSDSIELAAEFAPFVGRQLKICSVAPLFARIIAKLGKNGAG